MHVTPWSIHHSHSCKPLSLLLRHTDSPASSSGCLRVLSTHTQAPVVSKTPVCSDLLQALQVLAELAIHTVCQHLLVFTVDDVALSVQEPGRDLVLKRVLDDGDDALELFASEIAGATKQCVSQIVTLILSQSFEAHGRPGNSKWESLGAYRLVRSTSAFLHTKFEYRRPTPLILVNAYMTFCLPSTLVLRRRRMNWKFDFSPVTSARSPCVSEDYSCAHRFASTSQSLYK